jgi:hypothetical protein
VPRGNRYNPNTKKKVAGAPRVPHPSHAALCRLVEAHGPELKDTWSRRPEEQMFLCLGDLRRPDVLRMAEAQWGRELPAAVLDRYYPRLHGEESPPVLAMLLNWSWIDDFGADGDFAHRECARELRSFTGLASVGIVPLLVITPGGVWATQWADPDSGVDVLRYEPDTPADAN